MSAGFNARVSTLRKLSTQFNEASNTKLLHTLQTLASMPLPLSPVLERYCDTLQFVCAYPANVIHMFRAEQELQRITLFLKKNRTAIPQTLYNTGLPFTPFVTRYSHDCTTWLTTHPDCNVMLEEFRDAHYTLNDILKCTLPTVEQAETSAGLDNNELLHALRVPRKQRLEFLLNECSRLDTMPLVKDMLFDAMGMMIRITPTTERFSRAYNRIPVGAHFYHSEIYKRFDHVALLQTPLPQHIALTSAQQQHLTTVIKNTMALTSRETDPVTFLDEQSLRYYQLERGISVAIYGMTPQRQLPLEQYIGYTLFKNGLPAAYGGSWVFGGNAKFGINIFEPYRGGESGYVMCQLMRVYKHAFNIGTFEVEPYQYGQDNPDGIASGAFWFYYRFGFRPVDATLRTLAHSEFQKIKKDKTYRSPEKTLLRFTESAIVLKLHKHTTPNIATITAHITRMIQRTYNSNRQRAEQECVNSFMALTNIAYPHTTNEQRVLTEVALWRAALNITDTGKLQLLTRMVTTKPTDVYAYQQLLLELFT
ncbi:MAG: hypothetical protein JNJ85_01020 [Candidatus Kapabacteria bacterium]|nr:hypothetical protein [Candidatus Kapabacteria bacterium]